MACDGDGKENSYESKFSAAAKFDPIDKDREIHTENFLAACTGITTIAADLGKAFSFPKEDLLGNIKKIRNKYEMDKEKYCTLNKMMEEDSKVQGKNNPTATVVGFIWLLRGLEFFRAFIAILSEEFHNKVTDENLRPTVLKAYETSVKPYHGKLVQFAVSQTFRFIPCRSSILKSIATHDTITSDMVTSDIDKYLINFSATVELIKSLLEEYDLNLSLKA